MNLFPMVGRELRTTARRAKTYWGRSRMAFVAMVVAAIVFVQSTPFLSPAALGARVFEVLTYLACLMTILTAVALAADSLSSEKREGTLGFLFLSTLKPFEVVTGKLAAKSLTALYGLLALIPVFALPTLLGGVGLGDVFRLALLLPNTLFFGLSVVLFVSALNWEERQAFGLSALILISIGVLFPLAFASLSFMSGSPSILSALALAGPALTCVFVPASRYGTRPETFWISAAVTHLIGWLFLLMTCRLLPRVWQDRPAKRWRSRWRQWVRRVRMGSPAAQTTFRRRLLDVNPIFWLACRERRAHWKPWIFLGSVSLLFGACWCALQVRRLDLVWLIGLGFALHVFFKVWVANLACRAFAVGRDQGALELLLSTPISISEIIRGQRLALWRQMFAPILTIILLELLGFVTILTNWKSYTEQELVMGALFFLGNVGVFIADLFALPWVGWWSGLVSKNLSRAVSTTQTRILILPWLLLPVVFISLGYSFKLLGLSALLGPGLVLTVWTGLSLAADLFFGRRARAKLLAELRLVASERYGGEDVSTRSWRQWGRWLGLRYARRHTTS